VLFPFKGKSVSRMGKIVDFTASFLTVLGVVVSAFFYMKDRPVRNRDAVYAAWQIVASMEGKKGSGGREAAIAQLQDHREDLSGITLDSGYLKNMNLSDTNFLEASFAHTILSHSSFNNSHLSLSSFNHARFRNAQFKNASLDDTDFIGAIMTDADLGSAQIIHCVGDTVTTFNGSSFSNAKIAYSQFLGTNFDNTIFTNSNLVEVVLDDSFMRRSKLTDATWRYIKGCHLDMSLSEANNISIGGLSDLTGSRFDRTKFRFARFEGVNLTATSFFNSDLTGTVFVDSNLSLADFSSSTLTNAKIERCVIEKLDLSGADRSGLKIMNCTGEPIGLSIDNESK